MSYNPGNGRGSVQTVPVKNNESVILKSEKDLGYQAPETEGKEYYFAGWATSKDDANNGKATYAAGQSVHVDVDGENVLYATWIEKTVITLVANSNTVTYNGQSQEVNGFQSLTIDGYIVSGLNAHAQGTDVGTYPTEITGTAHVEKDNEDVTNKVVVKTTPGQLTITKKSIVPDDSNGIVVDGPKGSKYDGEKHENEPVVTDTKTGKTLVKGTDYTLTYSEDVINVGTVTVTITGTGNYEGTADTSYEITPRKVIMTSADGSKVYDGSALTKNKVTESEDGFVKDDGATYNVTGSQTETGSSKNTFTYTLNEKTLEKNYVIETKEGTLEVTPVTDKVVVEIKGKTKTETYNGNTYEVEGYDVTKISDALYPEEAIHFEGTAKASRKDVGTSYMGLNVSQFSNTSANFTNVTFRVTDGWLKVTPKSIDPKDEKTGIQVTKPEDTMYNGKEQKNKPTVEDTKTGATLVENVDYTLSYSEDVINAGTVTVTITGTGNYEGTVATSYEITPRKVIMTSADGSKVYDGSALTKNKVTESEDGFVKDDGATYNVTGSQTETGSSKNTFTYTLNEKTLEKNYVIETKEGTLEVTPVTDKVVVEIKGKTKTETYNGNTHEVEGYDVTNISNALYLEEAIHFEGAAKASRKDVGTTYMGLNASQFSNTSANFTNVTFRVTDGWLKVDPKSIVPSETNGMEVTGPADTMYNGDEQKLTPVVKDQGKVLTENVDYELSYTGDTTNVGTVKITVLGKGNYDGSTEVSYKITKRNVTLTSATDSKVYDKNPLTNYNVAVGGDGFVKEEGATYNVTGSQTEKGTSKNTFTYTLKKGTLASNYSIEVVYGDLTVTAEDGEVVVIITGRKDTFEYTGTEKSVKGYDVSITEGSTYTESDFTFSGNDEVKGTEAGTYDMGLKPEDFTNNNENYGNVTFRVVDGQLIITPKSINPEDEKTGITATDPADSIYDGKAHVNPLKVTDTKTGKDLVENKDYTLTYVGDVVNVGTVKVEVKGIGNYTGEFTKRYKITPREYTVTTDNAEKTYDGTALTAGGKIEGIVDGEVVVVHTTGSQTDVGSTLNTYELEWKKASSKNYKLKEEVIGTLTITEQTIDPGEDPKKPNPNYLGIEISNPSDEVYDGKEHKWSPTVVDKEGNALVEGTDYTVKYATSDFTNVGAIDVTITGIGNYTGTVTRAYKITPKAYTVTTESATKVYDGTALTAGGKVKGIISGETVEFTTTGSRIDEGTSKNTYSLKWNGSAIETNYKLEKVSIGDLTVKAKSIIPDEPDTPEEKKTGITVNEPSDSMYDGQEHKELLTVKDAKTGKELVSGTEYAVAYTGDLVNAGTVTITVTGKGNYT